MKKKIIFAMASLILSSGAAFADKSDITGLWHHMDDRLGTSKALVEIRKEANGTYTGTVVKVISRPGYTPKEFCVNCPAPYTDKPMLGLSVVTQLKQDKDNANQYVGGKVLDPLSGKIYSIKAKLNPSGNRLQMRGYIGVSALGRTQTWIRAQ